MKKKKTTTAPAPKEKPARPHPKAGGKAPRKSFPTHPPTQSAKPTKLVKVTKQEKLPWTKEEVIATRIYRDLSKEQLKGIRETSWQDEDYPLSAEKVLQPEKLKPGYKYFRVIHQFSFWLTRHALPSKDNSRKLLRPTAPVPGADEKWSDFILRGVVASLNGPARYLVMAGELYVSWPTMDSFPLELKTGEIEDIVMINISIFRDDKPSLAVLTSKYAYILLSPDDFFEQPWRSVIPFWETYMQKKDLFIEEIAHTEPRPEWWHGRKSHRAFRQWKIDHMKNSPNEPDPGPIDPSRDRPQPGDSSDDEYGLSDFSDYKGDSECSWSESGDDEKTDAEERKGVQRKGKGKCDEEQDEDSAKEQQEREESAKGKGKGKGKGGDESQEAKPAKKPRAKKQQQRADDGKSPLESKGLEGQSEESRKSKRIRIPAGTGPPKKLASGRAPVASGSKRKASEDHANPSDAVRPRHSGPSDEEATPSGLSMAQGLEGNSAERTSYESQEAAQHSPIGPKTSLPHLPLGHSDGPHPPIPTSPIHPHPFQEHLPPLSNIDYTASLFGFGSQAQRDHQVDGAGLVDNTPQIEGVSRGFGDMRLGSNAPIEFAQGMDWSQGWGNGLGVHQLNTAGGQSVPNTGFIPDDNLVNGPMMTAMSLPFFPDTDFGGMDLGNQQINWGETYDEPHMQEIESQLQQTAGADQQHFEYSAPHDVFFPQK